GSANEALADLTCPVKLRKKPRASLSNSPRRVARAPAPVQIHQAASSPEIHAPSSQSREMGAEALERPDRRGLEPCRWEYGNTPSHVARCRSPAAVDLRNIPPGNRTNP